MVLLENIHKSFGENEVLRGLDLEIGEGQTMVILGQSGCGKSVLLKLILRLMNQEEGLIVIDDEDTTDFSENQMMRVRKKFGMLFQSSALFDSISVADNVAYMLNEHTDMSRTEIANRVKEMLSFVDLSGVEEMMPADLSGGMKKRVALARALAFKPHYILYDEPTTGLDPLTAKTINELIRNTQERLDVTSIVVTHDLISAFYVGDRLALIQEGVTSFCGTPQEFAASTDPFIVEYLACGREYN
ncbi:MAG: ATP-binding cassette domain-containing protein [candidate division Zixibacteria bacterium]|nr:ATP-binding cassette domain-containing protein [candidate division Zixibacteria bacterium]